MRILAAVDVHDRGESVVDQAVPWARKFGARIDVVFASEWSTEGIPEAADRLDKLHQQWNALANEERAQLRELMERIPEDVRGNERIVAGRPVDVMPDVATSYDVLVIGTHGRVGLERVLLGSVASRLLRLCPVPILVVGLGDPVLPADRPMKVLAPVAHSEPGALPWLFATWPAEHIEIGHVLPPDRWLPPSALSATPQMPTDPAQRQAVVTELIRGRAAAHGFPKASIHVVSYDQQAGDTIARLAHDLGTDIVVMPTNARKGLDRWFIGSVAERVVEMAPCAVLVLPMAVAQPD